MEAADRPRTSPMRRRTAPPAVQRLASRGLQLADVLQHRLLAEDRERLERGDAGGRQPRPRRARGHVVEAHRALGAEHRADRHHAAAHRLAERHQVGLARPSVPPRTCGRSGRTRVFTSSAHEQEVELPAELGERRPERVRGAPRTPRSRAPARSRTPATSRGSTAWMQQMVAEVVDGAVARAPGTRGERRAIGVRVRHVDEPGHQRAVPEREVATSPRRSRRRCPPRRGSRP